MKDLVAGKNYEIRYLGDNDPEWRAWSGIGKFTGKIVDISGRCGVFLVDQDGDGKIVECNFPLEDAFECECDKEIIKKEMNTEFGLIDGPVWEEKCGHDGYIASFEYLDSKFDLYVFDNAGKQSVCIRYGDSGESYYSFHNITSLIRCTGNGGIMPIYDLAERILNHKGQFVWQPKK